MKKSEVLKVSVNVEVYNRLAGDNEATTSRRSKIIIFKRKGVEYKFFTPPRRESRAASIHHI